MQLSVILQYDIKEREKRKMKKLLFMVALSIACAVLHNNIDKGRTAGTYDLAENITKCSEGYLLEHVPHILQTEHYPTGCESVAAVSLLQYYDVDITIDAFIDNYLLKKDTPYYRDGSSMLYGESPWDYFIGNPYSESGYGCYSSVIETAMKKVVSEKYCIQNLSDMDLSVLCENYIAKGNPVMIWATMYMQTPREGDTWILPNGEQFTFICPEHALLLIGYDAVSYYFSDSLVEDAVISYPKGDCEVAYDALYRQAIAVLPVE